MAQIATGAYPGECLPRTSERHYRQPQGRLGGGTVWSSHGRRQFFDCSSNSQWARASLGRETVGVAQRPEPASRR